MHDPAAAPRARLFIALWPGEPVRDAIAAWQSAWRWPAGARPVPAEKLHLTLHFLGQVDADRIPALAKALRIVAPQAFTLPLGRPQDWEGIAVLRPLEVPDAARRLQEDIARALQAAGFETDARRWRPHVTLARKAKGASPPAVPLTLDWASDGRFVLVSSAGGVYRPLESFTA